MDKPWLRFYDPGVPEEVPYPEGMLVQHILEHTATRFPNRPATIFPAGVGDNLYEARVSYRDLDRAANRFANGLTSLGIRKGDRVALNLLNSPQFLISFFGAFKAGAVVIAFNPQYTPNEIERQLVDCGAETVVTTKEFYNSVKQVQPKTLVTRVVVANIGDYLHPAARPFFNLARAFKRDVRAKTDPRDYSFRQLLRHSSDVRPESTTSPDDNAVLEYTRGNKAAPKGAILSHRNLVSNCLQSAAWRSDAEAGHEVALCITPFYQPYGMQIGLLNNVFLGGALILFAEFEAGRALKAIEKYHPTVFPGVPALYVDLLNSPSISRYNLRSIRTSFSGGAPLPTGVQESWESLTGGRLVQGYGLAEASPLTHANPVHGMRKPGSIGLPIPGTLARIVDEKSTNAELAAGTVGELAIRGPQVFRGYWNRPEETAQALSAGWLLTGDLARMDADGFFYIENARR